MRQIMFALAAVTLAACSSDSPAPSCQQGLAHYYGAGCALRNLDTGEVSTQDQAVSGCQSATGSAPDACQGAIDDWLRCIDETSPAEQCDCSQEQMAIIRCGG